MEQNNNKGIYAVLGVLCVVVLALSISYAALSSTLNINFGTVTQSQQTWDVGFVAGAVTATTMGTSATGLTCGVATVTKNSVSVANSTISKPGDGCVYELTVSNSGTIDATLGTITNITPSATSCTESGTSMVCGNLTYKLTTDQAATTLLTGNVALAHQQQQTIYLSVQYTGTEVSQSAASQSGAGYTLVYNQA